jgi:hypothetical protein
MAITLFDLRTRCREASALNSDWTDGLLNGFIGDSIRAYSNEFPRSLRYSLGLTTGTQAYDLPANHQIFNVHMVEYPAGEDPAEYIYQVSEDSADFRRGGDVFALRAPLDSVAANADNDAGLIVLAETVTTGETAILHYTCCHRIPGADTDIITVPDAHIEAIMAHVDFRVHWEMESTEAYAQTAASSSLLLSQLGENGRRAWNRWREVMKLLRAPAVVAQNPSWGNIGL